MTDRPASSHPDDDGAAPDWLKFDWRRGERVGVPEAVLGLGKTPQQLVHIARAAVDGEHPLLFTRVDAEQAEALTSALPERAQLDAQARTVILGRHAVRPELDGTVAVVAAGSSDRAVASEAARTLWFHGADDVPLIMDVGVAGLWRLMERVEELARYRVVIAVAGMEGALFSVLAGLIPGLVIAVPTSVGYGVGAEGRAALHAALASCAPGLVVVNVDNGFGAACAALKALRS